MSLFHLFLKFPLYKERKNKKIKNNKNVNIINLIIREGQFYVLNCSGNKIIKRIEDTVHVQAANLFSLNIKRHLRQI